MKNKTRIAILGIGGIGGYFGGKLAAQYAGSEDFEIIFIARGENKKVSKVKKINFTT
jgi:2-dehydropantoate 2-reductase